MGEIVEWNWVEESERTWWWMTAYWPAPEVGESGGVGLRSRLCNNRFNQTSAKQAQVKKLLP